jgi:predicted phage terminase large subunit-like protein
MSTRGVARQARRVLIMQRLHANDLSSHVLAEGGWEHLCLPMRFERGRMQTTRIGWSDPREEEGQLLCPRLFSEERVRAMEKPLGSYGAAGQLQQRPVPRQGGMFQRQWFRIVDKVPANVRRVRYWDRAATQGGGCFTCGVLLARTSDGCYIVEDVVRGQWSTGRRDEIMLHTAQADRTRYGDQQPHIIVEREGGSSGLDSVWATARLFDGFPMHAIRPTGNKETRAEPFAAQCEAGKVSLVCAPWNHAYIEELSLFPMGTYADQVDASSGSYNYLLRADYIPRIHGEIVTSADMSRADFDPVEVYRPFDGYETTFDEREDKAWWIT